MSKLDGFLTQGEVSELVKLDRTTIYRRRQNGAFPEPVRIGNRKLAYRESEIRTWMEDPEGYERYVNFEGGHGFHGERVVFSRRVSKKAAGRTLDGEELLEFPSQ